MKKYKNKLFSILGDSISTLVGYSTPKYAVFYEESKKYEADIHFPEDTWWGQVINHLGGSILVNNSFSGSMVIKHPQQTFPSYGCSDERTSSLHTIESTPDVIMVFMGTNDWGAGVRPTPNNETENENYAIFMCAYRSMLEKIKKNYKAAEIWCFTLPISTCTRDEDFEFPYVYRDRHIEEYCKVIRQCAKEFGCKLIDLYHRGEPHDTIDGFHPNRYGMMILADKILDQLEEEN